MGMCVVGRWVVVCVCVRACVVGVYWSTYGLGLSTLRLVTYVL